MELEGVDSTTNQRRRIQIMRIENVKKFEKSEGYFS